LGIGGVYDVVPGGVVDLTDRHESALI